jgi:hypothetical protein
VVHIAKLIKAHPSEFLAGVSLHSLPEYLKEWQDFDVATYYVGCCLGVFPPPDQNGFHSVTHHLWATSEIGDTLSFLMQRLVTNGVLLYEEEGLRYRWNEEFAIDLIDRSTGSTKAEAP